MPVKPTARAQTGENRETAAAEPAPSRSHSLISRHLPSLDYLRGIAILLVLLFHAYGSVQWTAYVGKLWGSLAAATVGEFNYGVQLFFLLSGFLITNILLRSRVKQSYYRDFYIKRALRILPLYAVILIALKLWVPVTWGFFVASCLFLSNFARLFGAALNQYGPLWSLCVEEHFYLLWPTCVRRLNPAKLVPILVSIIVLDPILRFVAITYNSSIDIRFKTPFLLDFIAYGALIATLIYLGKLHSENIRRVAYMLLAIGIPLVLFTLFLVAFHDSVGLVALRTVPWMWTCAGILMLGLKRDSEAGSSKQSRGVLPFYASISYGLYLIDPLINEKLGPVIAPIFQRYGLTNLSFATAELVACGMVATGIAYISSRCFEQPINNLKRATHRHPSLPQPAHSSSASRVNRRSVISPVKNPHSRHSQNPRKPGASIPAFVPN